MFSVVVKQFDNYSDAEMKKVMTAITVWERVWNSDEFKKAVLGFNYYDVNESVDVPGFYFTSDEKKFTNQEVYDKLMRVSSLGICKFSLGKKWNVWWSKAEAATDFQSQYVTIYSRYFAKASIADLADTLAHEAGSHCAGFEHEFNWNNLRDYSVPYAVGYITQDLAEKLGY